MHGVLGVEMTSVNEVVVRKIWVTSVHYGGSSSGLWATDKTTIATTTVTSWMRALIPAQVATIPHFIHANIYFNTTTFLINVILTDNNFCLGFWIKT